MAVSSGIEIERSGSREEFEEFARFPFVVYRDREAWWPPDVRNEVDLLEGRSPLCCYLEMEPLRARRAGRMVARVVAIVNHRYNEHWNDKLGHLIHFEALAGEEDAVAAMLDAACGWLRARGMKAVRTGFAAFLDYPYAIDNYDALPSFLLRGNPPYYHNYFKNAGFETEKGQLDYSATLVPEWLARYRTIVNDAQRSGVQILSWREFGFLAAIDAWTDVTNAAFDRHWGWNPVARTEVRPMLLSLWGTPVADLSMIAVANSAVVGAVFSVPDLRSSLASFGARVERGGGSFQKAPKRRLHGDGGRAATEKRGALINIGVLKQARGQGVARAAAARSFLEMGRQGMGEAGYTLVLDDNWPSRRTAASLGARVTSNFVSYRRELFERPSGVKLTLGSR